MKHQALVLVSCLLASAAQAGNPVITEVFTADPAPLVVGDTVYLYCGQDEAKENENYRMFRWLCFSSKDLVTWKNEGSPLKPTDFKWAVGDAWASQVIERGGKYYFFATVQHDGKHHGKAIGVAVADNPTGPFKDAIGKALVTNDMTTATKISWDDIDPTVWIDDDDQAWLFWGNQKCYWAKLKDNMTELEGEIHVIPDEEVKGFTEAPWIHKKGDLYYLSYATGFPEKCAYSVSKSLEGPWKHVGLLAEVAGNSNTIHQGIIEFKGKDYFFYHNGAMQHPNTGGSFRRSVCIEELQYEPDGHLKRIVQTTEGIEPAE